MDRGVRYLLLIALAAGMLAHACRRQADGANLQTVDSLITRVDAAILTLNELDAGRFRQGADAFAARETLFDRRFNDTLDQKEAELLGSQFLILDAASEMAADHERTLKELEVSAERLRNLRTDVMNAAMSTEEEEKAIGIEQHVHQLLHANVEQTIANYRSMQDSWERLPATDSLLNAADTVTLP